MSLQIRKLETREEYFESERLLSTAFLHDWDEKEAEENAANPKGETWAAFDGTGRMMSAVSTLRHGMTYEGSVISCGELHMVGSLPESRGSGAVRALMGEILRDYKGRGDLFATLIPFSFAFYRKYGFEAASELLDQKADIDQFAGFALDYSVRQISSQADVDTARGLYEAFARGYNLADIRDEEAWTCRDNGEFGERDWMNGNRQPYSYLFLDGEGKARAYFTFVFVHGPEGPFVGDMKITDLAFDSPEALRNVFGFIYGMRAKIRHVSVSLPGDVDLSLMLPESDAVERKLDSHYTARVLNVDKVLTAMRQPGGSGAYSILVTDRFLPENSGTYTVSFADGVAGSVEMGDGPADLEVTVETLCQLAVGRTDLGGSLYRAGTVLRGNEDMLRKVFRKRPVMLG